MKRNSPTRPGIVLAFASPEKKCPPRESPDEGEAFRQKFEVLRAQRPDLAHAVEGLVERLIAKHGLDGIVASARSSWLTPSDRARLDALMKREGPR